MDREPKTQRPGAAAPAAHDAAGPGRSTLVDDAHDADAAPAIPRLDLRPSTKPEGAGEGAGTGRPGASPQRAAPPHAAPAASAAAGNAVVRHRVADPAPNGSPTRTRVGVGESIRFESMGSGSWHADLAAAGIERTMTTTSYTWVAPSTPGVATITFTPSTPGQAPVPTQITVLAPTVDYVNPRPFTNHDRPGRASVAMHTDVVFGPDDVSFANTQWRERPGPAPVTNGYFRTYRPIDHDPLRRDSPINRRNRGPVDEAGYWDLATSTYGEGGTFEWVIPTLYSIVAEEGVHHQIRDVHQQFTLAPDGTMTVTKGSATLTRRP